jgi:hypothetical protein
MRDTKRVYDGTLYNVFIGATETSEGEQEQTVTIPAGSTDEAEAKLIAQKIADLMIEMGDYSRAFNDYGNLRSFGEEAIKVVWNSKIVNKIRKVDLPAIFHKDGLMDKFEEEVLPARYFGRAVAAGDKGEGKVINASGEYDPTKGTLRARVEKDVTISGAVKHVFPGDELPAGSTVGASKNFAEAEVYVEDESIICKVLVKLPPYMSAFEVGTSFFNPKSLTENHYLTFGHNTIEYLKNYPFITVRKA